jgi:hypothetical protein
MSELEREARQFKKDTEAKLQKHDERLRNQYTATEELISRVAKLERQIVEILGKKS